MAKISNRLKILNQVVVATAGTPVPLSAVPFLVYSVTIQWVPNNAGAVYVGESDVTQGKCIELTSGTPSLNLTVDDTMGDEDFSYIDLNQIYVDAQNNGDKVNVAYLELVDVNYNG